MATRLLVARHGETVDNAGERWQGWSDSPLTARGRRQAEALGRRLAGEPLAAAYSSDLGRAMTTARIACLPHRLTPFALPALRERDVGLFSGLSGVEVAARYPEAVERRHIDGVLDWAPPQGESFRQMLDRLVPALQRIAVRWDGRTVLVVTHGGVVRLLAAYAQDEDWSRVYQRHPTNCGLSVFVYAGELRPRLERFDEHDYLEAAGAPPLTEDRSS